MRVERYFVVCTSGHTGSAFLSKILNSHLDVICFHEFGLSSKYAQFYEFSQEEIKNSYAYLFGTTHHYGDTYRVIGTVETFPKLTVEDVVHKLPPALQSMIFFFYWVRHPILVINSAYREMLKYINTPWGKGYLKKLEDDLKKLEETFKSDPEAKEIKERLKICTKEEKLFFMKCLQHLSFLKNEIKPNLKNSFSIESFTADINKTKEILKRITGLSYDHLSKDMLGDRCNVKAGGKSPQKVFDTWPSSFKEIFRRLIWEKDEELFDYFEWDYSYCKPSSTSIVVTNPFISIGIPTYNRAHYLKQCLESCLNQNYEHYEIIVIDDGSTDETPQVVEKLKKRSNKIKFFRLEKNTQGRQVWLPFLKEAKGDYYLSLGDDDYLQTNILPFYAETVEKYKADVIYGDLMAVNEKGGVFDCYKYQDWYLKNRELKKALFLNCCIPDPGCMIKAKVYRDRWFYRKGFSYVSWDKISQIISKVGDYLRWILFCDTCTFKHLGVAPIFYRIHPGSDSIPKLKDWSEESFIKRLMLCLYPIEEIFFDLNWQDRNEAGALAFYQVGKVLMMLLDFYNAIRFFKKALKKTKHAKLLREIFENLLLCQIKSQGFIGEEMFSYARFIPEGEQWLENTRNFCNFLKLQITSAKALIAKGELLQAKEILKKLKENIGHTALRANELGLLYWRLGEREKAFGYLRYAVLMNPLNEVYYKNALGIASQMGKEKEIEMTKKRILTQPEELIRR
ncbi:MAG: glycosyltransferase [Candidatus Desulfofervidaceae bacterium]|nr:glycosyltransferase [Candidatus Desulfofervidaceae bacterium]